MDPRWSSFLIGFFIGLALGLGIFALIISQVGEFNRKRINSCLEVCPGCDQAWSVEPIPGEDQPVQQCLAPKRFVRETGECVDCRTEDGYHIVDGVCVPLQRYVHSTS